MDMYMHIYIYPNHTQMRTDTHTCGRLLASIALHTLHTFTSAYIEEGDRDAWRVGGSEGANGGASSEVERERGGGGACIFPCPEKERNVFIYPIQHVSIIHKICVPRQHGAM
jgi:hypothetical protein